MKRLLELILFGHIHKFRVIKEEKVIDTFINEGWRYVQECECCGQLKKTTFI
jgi:hypothetical protein